MELTRRGLLPLGFAAAAIRPASGQEGMVALQGAAVFDGERRLGPATILIAGESIRAVGPGAAVPAGARRIDLAGRTVIPGLVSAHSHVGNSEGADTGGRFGTRENVLAQLGHLPTTGENFRWRGLRFEVVDMDGRRIDKLLVHRLAQA